MHNQLPCALSQGMHSLLFEIFALLAAICLAACQKLAHAALGVGQPAVLANFTAGLFELQTSKPRAA